MGDPFTLKVEIDAPLHIAAIFSTSDNLSAFARGMTDKQVGALYDYLHSMGARYTGHGISDWEKSK